MEAAGQAPLFIHTRRGAIIALCFTSYVALQEVWACFAPPREHFRWLMFDGPPDLGLPFWAIAAINLAFYACSAWLFIRLYQASRGRERVLIAGFSFAIVGFIRPLLPGDLAIPARYAEAAGMVAAAIASAYLVFERPPRPDSVNQTSKAATVAAFGAALLLGFLIALTESRSGWASDGTTMAGLALGAAAFSLINRSHPWLWALGIYASIPVFYAIAPPRHLPWVVPSGPLPFGMNNRGGLAVNETLVFLLVAIAGAYAGVLMRKLLDRRGDSVSSVN